MIAQRLVVEQVLPIEQIGDPAIADSKEMDMEEKKSCDRSGTGRRSGAASEPTPAKSTRMPLRFAAAPVDYIYEQSPRSCFARYCRNM